MKARKALAFSFVLVALAGVAVLLSVAASAALARETAPAARPCLPGGSTIQGVLSANDTWGPGLITVTGDILISPTVVITIATGTTVQVEPVDAANLGLDPARIEYLVEGTLLSNGPVTFTSKAVTPACGDWVGIFFRPGSSGHLNFTLVEYGVHAVEVNTANQITIADSALRLNCHEPLVGDAWGAGLAIYGGTHRVLRTEIHHNVAKAGAGGAWARGGGVEMTPGAGPTLFQDCKLYANKAENLEVDAAGGGLDARGADPILERCEVYDNEVQAVEHAYGGGVNLHNSSGTIRADSSIRENTATAANANAYGGGISIGEDMMAAPPAPAIYDSHITGNILVAQEAWAFGGGIGFPFDSWTTAVVSDTRIADNSSQAFSSFGVSCGGGIGLANGATASMLDGNVFHANLAEAHGGGARGGGLCLYEENAITVTNNLLADNDAQDVVGWILGGGGIYANAPAVQLVNNTIVENRTTGNGGGVYLQAGVLLNTIVVSNTASADGGGVYWGGGSADFGDVWGNTCFAAGCGADYAASGLGPPANDISQDPEFISSGGLGAFYHLRWSSPCIDVGVGPGPAIPNHDFDGEPRPWGPAWDMGFDEVLPHFMYLPAVLVDY
jgi:hypothetical protein